ncbi:DNA alkylation repair protein [Alkalilimnicola ehrlichii]|uniref:DNA alkylation repair protein n=1 Tax=Alkalilimnicola ehrlichii TaxID=351052 RepID=UPI001C6DFA28|nr:DNA alkylation repair protein [Alkalilimnicola ehrlichii]
MQKPTAEALLAELRAIGHPEAVEKVRRFYKGPAADGEILGVGIGQIFPLAKRYTELPLNDIEQLLESPYYEVRMAAVSVMDFQARQNRCLPNGARPCSNSI